MRDVAWLSVEGFFVAVFSDLQTLILNERSQGYEVPPDEWLKLFERSRQTKESRRVGPVFLIWYSIVTFNGRAKKNSRLPGNFGELRRFFLTC